MKKLLTSIAATLLVVMNYTASADDLKIGFADPISSMDPQLNNHAGDRSNDLHFWNFLTQIRDNRVEPDLASSWKTLDDNTWEFKLRDDVKWQDGTPLTADDIIFSYQRARNVPGSVASFSGYLRTIASVEAKDPHTLIIKTTVPNPDIPLNVASVHIVSKHIGENATTDDYNSGKAMVGTGPFKFQSYVPGDVVTMTRSDTYFHGKSPWDNVIYRYIANPASRTAALLAGDVDVIDKISASDLVRLRKNEKVNVYEYPGLRVMLLQPSFNPAPNAYIKDNNGQALDKNPLTDVRVRQALNIAINRDIIVDRVLQNSAAVASQWMPEGAPGYNVRFKKIAFDVDKAKKLLADAGYPEGFQMIIDVPSDRYPLAPETAQAVAQFWTRIGVKTKVEVVPWAVYASKARSNDYAMTMLAWGNGTGEGSYALVNVYATVSPEKGLGASNWGHYSSEALDQILAKYTETFDDTERAKIMDRAVEIINDDVAAIPLYHYKNIWATRKGLKVTPLTSDRTVAQMVEKIKE